MIRQFYEFFDSSIWQVFDNWPNCAARRSVAGSMSDVAVK